MTDPLSADTPAAEEPTHEEAYAEACRSIRATAQTLARAPALASQFLPLGHIEGVARKLQDAARAVATRQQNVERAAQAQAGISVD